MSLKLFFCYAHEDEKLLKKLKAQLRPLQRQELIDELWHDRDIKAGTLWEQDIYTHLNTADIILLLVSPDFIDSDYCYGTEMKRALERHKSGEAHVIPVILRPVYWQGILGELQALPTDGKPIAGSSWYNEDEGFFSAAEGIRTVVEELVKPSQRKMSSSALMSPIKPDEITLLHTLQGHSSPIYSLALSPTEPLLASGDSKTIKLWNLNKRTILHTLNEHSSLITSLAFSPDGQLLASGSYDQTIKLWDPHSGTLLCTLQGHKGAVSCVAFSPDGQLLASSSYDQGIKLWNMAKRTISRTFRGEHEIFYSVTFSPIEQLLISGSNKTIKLWNPKKGTPSHTLAEQEAFYSTMFSFDGQLLVTGSTKSIKLRNPHTGDLLRTIEERNGIVYSLAFRPDGQMLASGSDQSTIKIWDPHTGKMLCSLDGHKARVSSVAFSMDGQLLASGSHDQTVKIWGKK